MRSFIKQNGQRFSLLFAALIIGGGILTACASAVRDQPANDKASTPTAQNKTAAGEGESAANKLTENKEPAETDQSKAVTVYDGREIERDSKEAASDEKKLVETEFKKKEAAIKQKFGDGYCVDNEGVGIESSVKGSFTKPNASQTAFFYTLCSSGSSKFGVGGIMIFEDGKAVAHYAYGENGLDNSMFALPDVNKNGLSELVLDGGSTHQGYTGGSIVILEFKDGTLENLGGAETYESNDGAVEDEAKIAATAYKILVQPAPNPIFLRETYEKKGTAKNWTLKKKAEKFTLEKGNPGKIHKIS